MITTDALSYVNNINVKCTVKQTVKHTVKHPLKKTIDANRIEVKEEYLRRYKIWEVSVL